jgi:hypothetical protein
MDKANSCIHNRIENRILSQQVFSDQERLGAFVISEPHMDGYNIATAV